MKRKSLNKVLALALASVMTLGLAACGNGDSESSSAGNSSETGSSDAGSSDEGSSGEAGGEQASGERQTISFSVIDINAGSNNVGEYAEQILNQVRDYTNVNVELTWVANDALADKNALYLTNPAQYYHLGRHNHC